MQEDKNLVYLKDAYSTKIAPVALSSEEGMTDPRLCSTPGSPNGYGEELLAPRIIPAVFGTTVRTTGGVDREMLVSAPASPFIAVVRPDGFARTYYCGSDSPVFLDTGDPTSSRPVPRLRCCLRVLDFASDIDPGPDLSWREVVSASDERSGALALPGELLPVAPCYVDIFARRVSPQLLTFLNFMQKTVHVSLTGTVWESSGYINPSADNNRLVVRESPGVPFREGCGYICAEVWDARSFWSDLATKSHLFRLPVCSGLVVWESPGLPVRKECSYICAVIGEARSICSELVTESYLVVPAVRVELVLRELRRLLELLLWTDFSCSGIFRTRWWRFIMSSGMDPTATKPAVWTPAVLEPLPSIFRGFDLTLQADCLYDLDKDIADVIYARYSLAAVVKVMSILNNSI